MEEIQDNSQEILDLQGRRGDGETGTERLSRIHGLSRTTRLNVTFGTAAAGPTGGTLISSTSVTPSVTGTYVLACAACEFTNSNTGSTHTISVYLQVDGRTSNVTNSSIIAKGGGGAGVNGYTQITVYQTSNLITNLNSVPVQVYAFTDATSGILSTHVDVYALANLFLSP
jgi:hypothetical protein